MQNATEYYNKKMQLLSQLLECSENIMSSINQDQWEAFEELGNKRIEVIEAINALEADNRAQFDSQLNEGQRNKINAKVQLILGFEQDVIARIKEEQAVALKGMEAQKNGDIILNAYAIGDTQVTGVRLDTKK